MFVLVYLSDSDLVTLNDLFEMLAICLAFIYFGDPTSCYQLLKGGVHHQTLGFSSNCI
jgi:hypothetical protein